MSNNGGGGGVLSCRVKQKFCSRPTATKNNNTVLIKGYFELGTIIIVVSVDLIE